MAYLSAAEYERFVRHAEAGHLLLGVEPAAARKFFMSTTAAEAQEQFGESLSVSRFVIKAAFLSQWIALFASFGIAVWALSWLSILVIPISAVIAFWYMGRASVGRQGIASTGYFFGMTIVACFAMYSPPQLWIAAYTAVFFSARLTYYLSTLLLRVLVCRNRQACNALEGSVFEARTR